MRLKSKYMTNNFELESRIVFCFKQFCQYQGFVPHPGDKTVSKQDKHILGTKAVNTFWGFLGNI